MLREFQEAFEIATGRKNPLNGYSANCLPSALATYLHLTDKFHSEQKIILVGMFSWLPDDIFISAKLL